MILQYAYFVGLFLTSAYAAINPIEIRGKHFFDSVTKKPVS